jgi:hypothetical protein
MDMDPGLPKGKINVVPSVSTKVLSVRTPKKRNCYSKYMGVGPLRSKLLTKFK